MSLYMKHQSLQMESGPVLALSPSFLCYGSRKQLAGKRHRRLCLGFLNFFCILYRPAPGQMPGTICNRTNTQNATVEVQFSNSLQFSTAFSFQDLMRFKLRLIDICQKIHFLLFAKFRKCSIFWTYVFKFANVLIWPTTVFSLKFHYEISKSSW